jgi:WD40 repeat protein
LESSAVTRIYDDNGKGVKNAVVHLPTRRAAALCQNKLALINLDDGTELAAIPDQATPDVEMVFVNNGSHLLYCWGGQLRLHDAESLVTTRVFRQTGAQAVAAAPGGKGFCAGIREGHVLMWKSVTDEIRSSWEGLEHVATQIRYSPDGRRVLAGAADGSITLWDVETATRIARFPAHVGAVVLLEFTPDGSTLISDGTDGTVKIWPGVHTPPGVALMRLQL